MSRIFVDSADEATVARWLGDGVAQGVTTNSSIVRRDGGSSLTKLAARLLSHDPPELHIQVLVEDDDEAYGQASNLAGIDPRIRIKIPIVASTGLPRLSLIERCVSGGIPVNVTACTTLGQALAASTIQPDYVSMFWCRLRDGGGDPALAVSEFTMGAVDRRPSLIVGSLRVPDDVTGAWTSGADVITVPPSVLENWFEAQGSVDIAGQFQADAAYLTI